MQVKNVGEGTLTPPLSHQGRGRSQASCPVPVCARLDPHLQQRIFPFADFYLV
jgi:hypothetical protein